MALAAARTAVRAVALKIDPLRSGLRKALLAVLQTLMQKPPTFAQKFHDFFSTQTLMFIIFGLIGMIAMRLLGF